MDLSNVHHRNRISFADMALQSDVLQNDNTRSNRQSVLSDGQQEGMSAFYAEDRNTQCSNSSDPSLANSISDTICRKERDFITDGLVRLRVPSYLLRLLACLTMAIGSTVVFEFVLNDLGLTFQRPMLLAMQIFCIVFLFYALATYLRNVWTSESICAMFCVCICVEFIIGYTAAQDILDAGFVQPVLTLVVLLFVGGVSMFASLDIYCCALVITGISIIRFWACSMISDIPRWLRPVIAYCSGAVGVVAARYTVIALHSVSDGCSDGSHKRQEENSVTVKNLQTGITSRRVSLPNISRKNVLSSSSSGVSIESTFLMKAEGLLTDLIADPAVPRHILRGLRAVKMLLKQSGSAVTTRRSKSNPLVSLSSTALSAQTYSDLPYTDDYIHFYSSKSLHRSSQQPVSLNRCRSVGTWTTTTSATGMPSLESELQSRTKFRLCSESNLFSRLDRNWTITDDDRPTEGEVMGDEACPRHQRSSGEREASDDHLQSRKAGQSATNFQLEDDHDHSLGHSGDCKATGKSKSRDATVGQNHVGFSESRDCSNHSDREAFSGNISVSDDLEKSSLLEMKRLQRWDYPIFDLAAKAPDTILCRVSYKIFKELRFFETFSIPVQEFLNYFHALELGYHNNPYHNRIHATDVLHAVFYMTTQLIPGFVKVTPDDDYKSIDGAEESEKALGSRLSDIDLGSGEMDCCMRSNFLPLELMALYTAAAMHDYDHPGRTNAFLVSTCNPLAVLYNNRSVLENHHASAGWSLLFSSERYAWLANLNNAQFKRFRFLVIEAILATDLARHFDLLAEFNAKVNEDDGSGIDWSLEADRQTVSIMLIKMADINGPCKPRDLHMQWTSLISEEFYEQGDEEDALGLAISPYMNRHQPQLAKLQESFITHLVAPLCNSLSSAGLLPAHQSADQDCNDVTFGKELPEGDVICPMIWNLEENQLMWVKMIEDESDEQNPKVENTTHEDADKSNIPPEERSSVSKGDDANGD